MNRTRSHESIPGTTYHGFSAAMGTPQAVAGQPHRAPPARRSVGRPLGLVLAGVAAVAVAAGIGFGWRNQGYRDTPVAPSAPAVPLNALPSAPPTETAAVVQPAYVPPAPHVEPRAADPAPAKASPVRAAPVRRVARKPAPAHRVVRAPAKAAPAFQCRGSLRRSERMICRDATLAQLDRRLNRAYSQAVAAGVPRARLRAAQDRWVLHREVVARRSPGALAAYYRQRIGQLDRMTRRHGR